MDEGPSQTCSPSELLVAAYKRYFRLWINLAKTVNGSEDDAKDVVQNVISSILSDPGKQFESMEHVRNYMARAVINRAIQMKQRNEKSVKLGEEHEGELSVLPEVLQEGLDEELLALKQGIGKLSKDHFQVIKLRFFFGMSFVEMGKMLGIPVSTLKSREEAAVRRLRKNLRKKGF